MIEKPKPGSFAAFATESLSEDPERSILLRMEAVNAILRFDHHSLPVAEDVLHRAILSFRRYRAPNVPMPP